MAEICDRCRCDRQFHRAGWCLNCGRSGCAQFLAPPNGDDEAVMEVHELLVGGSADLAGLMHGLVVDSPPLVLAARPADEPASPLESFNAWRCYICGMRSYRREKCCRLMDPVRVEIHSRDSP